MGSGVGRGVADGVAGGVGSGVGSGVAPGNKMGWITLLVTIFVLHIDAALFAGTEKIVYSDKLKIYNLFSALSMYIRDAGTFVTKDMTGFSSHAFSMHNT